MFSKLKQFKELRSQAKELQNQMAAESVTVDSNWGKLKLTINGNIEVTNLSIDQSLLKESNKESLEKDLKNLFNDGAKKVQKEIAAKMAKSGNMPDLSSFFKQ